MAVIELEVLSGRGGWEGTKGNLTGYTYKEASTPIAAGDSSGETPSFTVGVSEEAGIDGTFALLESRVKLTDDAAGTALGIVRTVSSVDGAAGLEVESLLSVMNAEIQVGPYVGTLGGAFAVYMSIVGIAPADFSVDPTIATNPVTLPGWVGSVWDNLKQLCVAHRVEIVGVNGRLLVRPLRNATGNDDRNMSVTYSIDNVTIAKAVEVYYYNNVYKPIGLMYPPSREAATVIQVEAGEKQVLSVPVNVYPGLIVQPVPVSSTGDDFTTPASTYTVIDKDGLVVEPGLWTGTGGSITVLPGKNSPSELEITISGAALSARAPFRIAMPANPLDKEATETFASLRISGGGVFFTKQMFTIPTGADPKLAVAPVGVTIDNPFISTIEQASSAGILAAKNYSGRNKKLEVQATSVANLGLNGSIALYTWNQFQIDYAGKTWNQFQTQWAGKTWNQFVADARSKSADQKLIQAFGHVVGARIPYRDSMFRIREVTYTENGLQFTAESDTLAKDFASALTGMTWNDFQLMMKGRTYNDLALAPLYRPAYMQAKTVNYAQNPKLDTGIGWFNAANAALISRVANTLAGSANALKVEFPSGGVADSGVNITSGMTTNGDRLKPSTLYTFSFNIYSPTAQTLRFSCQGTAIANGPINETFSVPANELTRVSFQVTTNESPSATLAVYVLRGAAGQLGTLYMSNFMYTEGTATPAFYDGDSPGWAWLGAVGNSKSTGFEFPA